jgi:hypothetical protein
MKDLSDQKVQRISQYLTTEHFTLQGARNGAIAEANGRLGHFLSTVGSGIVALAFVANTTQFEPLFTGFSAVIFPILIILGAMTFIRTIQIGVQDTHLAQAINRIRHYYLEVAPEAESYFSFPHFDNPETIQKTMRPFHSPLQGLASTPGPVMLINSVLVGAFAGILAVGIFSLELIAAMIVSLIFLIIAFTLHRIYAAHIWQRETSKNIEVRFPSLEDKGETNN